MCIYGYAQQGITRSDMVKVAIEKLLNDHNQSYSVVHGYKAQITEEDVIQRIEDGFYLPMVDFCVHSILNWENENPLTLSFSDQREPTGYNKINVREVLSGNAEIHPRNYFPYDTLEFDQFPAIKIHQDFWEGKVI